MEGSKGEYDLFDDVQHAQIRILQTGGGGIADHFGTNSVAGVAVTLRGGQLRIAAVDCVDRCVGRMRMSQEFFYAGSSPS